MGTADLKLGTVILPRSESPKAISRLTEFEWYHKIDSSSDLVTPEIDDLLLTAQQIPLRSLTLGYLMMQLEHGIGIMR